MTKKSSKSPKSRQITENSSKFAKISRKLAEISRKLARISRKLAEISRKPDQNRPSRGTSGTRAVVQWDTGSGTVGHGPRPHTTGNPSDRPPPPYPMYRVPPHHATPLHRCPAPVSAVWVGSPGFFRLQWSGHNTDLSKMSKID